MYLAGERDKAQHELKREKLPRMCAPWGARTRNQKADAELFSTADGVLARSVVQIAAPSSGGDELGAASISAGSSATAGLACSLLLVSRSTGPSSPGGTSGASTGAEFSSDSHPICDRWSPP